MAMVQGECLSMNKPCQDPQTMLRAEAVQPLGQKHKATVGARELMPVSLARKPLTLPGPNDVHKELRFHQTEVIQLAQFRRES
jgi:hypothetical protein